MLAAGGDGGHDALDEATAGAGLGAEADGAPQHAGADGAFGSVIGGLGARHVHKSPEGRVEPLQDAAEGPRALVGSGGAFLQRGADGRLHRGHRGGKGFPGERAVADAMPEREEGVAGVPQGGADGRGAAATVDQFLKVAPQMRPAQLVLVQRQPPVGGVPVRVNDPRRRRAQQLGRHFRRATAADGEDGDRLGDRRPQPRFGQRTAGQRGVGVGLALLAPAGFIDPFERRRRHGRPRGVIRRLQAGAHGGFQPRHAGGTDRQAAGGGQQIGDRAFRQMILAGQQGDQGSHARAVAALWDAGGQRRRRALPAVRAGERVPLVFGDRGGERRDVPHLVALGRRVRQRGRQGLGTVRTDRRAHGDDLGHLVGGHQRALGIRMPRLPAGGTRRRRFGGPRRRAGRIGRGRQGGVLGGESQALLHALMLVPEPFDIPADVRGNRRPLLGTGAQGA